MPSYVRAGSLPHKRHIQFRRPDGGLYAEELFSTKGFESVYSLLYHLRPPTATLEVRAWDRPSGAPSCPTSRCATGISKPRAFTPVATRSTRAARCSATTTCVISIAQADAPMEYWYRNTGGDELLFIHHGAGVLETPFGELAYRATRLRRHSDRNDLPRAARLADAHARARVARHGHDSAALPQRIRAARRARAVLRARLPCAGAQERRSTRAANTKFA